MYDAFPGTQAAPRNAQTAGGPWVASPRVAARRGWGQEITYGCSALEDLDLRLAEVAGVVFPEAEVEEERAGGTVSTGASYGGGADERASARSAWCRSGHRPSTACAALNRGGGSQKAAQSTSAVVASCRQQQQQHTQRQRVLHALRQAMGAHAAASRRSARRSRESASWRRTVSTAGSRECKRTDETRWQWRYSSGCWLVQTATRQTEATTKPSCSRWQTSVTTTKTTAATSGGSRRRKTQRSKWHRSGSEGLAANRAGWEHEGGKQD